MLQGQVTDIHETEDPGINRRGPDDADDHRFNRRASEQAPAGMEEHQWFGYLALNACTVIWGTQHAVNKALVAATPLPSLINAIRFSSAAIFTVGTRALVGVVRGSSSKPQKRSGFCGLLIGAAELAVWQTLGFTLQLIGLRWTTASRSAFLLYLNATMVPVIATLLGERGIGLRTWACVIVAVVGTLMLCHDGGEPNIGDLWSLGAAASSAVFIVRLTHAAKGRDAAELSAATLLFTSLGCWAISAVMASAAGLDVVSQAASMITEHWPALLYLSVVVSAAASWLQAAGQQAVPPHEAVVIYTLDPVYGALFAWILLGEQLHALGWLGVALVVVANLLRRLPWHELPWAARRLVTPAASEVGLAELGDSKRAPLLGTPQTPAWLQKVYSRAVARWSFDVR